MSQPADTPSSVLPGLVAAHPLSRQGQTFSRTLFPSTLSLKKFADHDSRKCPSLGSLSRQKIAVRMVLTGRDVWLCGDEKQKKTRAREHEILVFLDFHCFTRIGGVGVFCGGTSGTANSSTKTSQNEAWLSCSLGLQPIFTTRVLLTPGRES